MGPIILPVLQHTVQQVSGHVMRSGK